MSRLTVLLLPTAGARRSARRRRRRSARRAPMPRRWPPAASTPMRSTTERTATRSTRSAAATRRISANYAPGAVDRGLSQRYGHENMVRDCVRNTGTETDRSDRTTAPAHSPEPEAAADVASLSAARRRPRATQCAHLLRRQRHLLDRFVDAAGRHRLAGLGTDAFGAVGQRHRVLQPGAVGGDLAARRRGGRSDRPGAADGGLAVRRRRRRRRSWSC